MIELVDHSTVELIKANARDEDVAYAAWVSNYGDPRGKDTARIKGLINFLYREQHTTPFEHGSFTWLVDTSIGVSREYMRHRTWSYNETSTRYRVMEPRFYVPNKDRPLVQTGKIGAYKHVAGTEDQYEAMRGLQMYAFEESWYSYQKQLDLGVAKEVARNVLPLALMTQFYATTNPLNALKFFLLRSEENALHEIRAVSQIQEEIFKQTMPLTYEAFDNTRETWRKVKRLLELEDIDTLLESVERQEKESLELLK